MAVISNGTTLIDNGILDAAVPTGKMILISEQTASGSANISFTSGIDSTYDSYVFKFINIHPSTDDADFTFNMSTDSGSNYNVTKTTTFFRAFHNEADTETGLSYDTVRDLAQSTAFQIIADSVGNGADECCVGTLSLFNPSSTTYVKHFIATAQNYNNTNYSFNFNVAGYGNTTSAVNSVKFLFDTGNIDAGKIKLYGIKDA